MTSFNEWIDGDIDFINYNEFSNMKKVGEGSFGIVESTDWKSYKIQAALKTLISNTIDDYDLNNFVKELKNLKKASFHPNIIGFYGITKEPLSNKYIMVLEYANQGNLREYLKNNFKFLQWSDKIQMALDIARGLICLHFKNIIHRDLHAKNILVNNNRLMITDFGTSKQLLEHTSNSTHSTADGLGMAEYNEPQLFKIINYKKDKKSDIYSLGVLLWEISSGRLPFPDYPRNVLGSHISHLNLRENPIEGTPLKYQQLYQECWDNEPKSRPDIEKVYETLSQLITEDFSSLSSSQPNVNEINEIKNSTIDYNDDLSISGYLNSRRVSSHKPDKPDGFTEEALNNWWRCNNIKSNNIRSRSNNNKIRSFEFGKSGNAIIDDFILKNGLKWIPYNKFKNVEYLDEEGFNTIYKATWLKNNRDREVILKCHNYLNENLNEFLNEFKFHESCLDSNNIINLYGFTKNLDTLKYIVVMDYANKGNLRENLTRIVENNWNQKLYMLYQIISGLSEIHKQNLIHCNIHDGNILIHKGKEDKEDKVYICDFGSCRSVKSFFKKYDIYDGVIPFMAPEVLRGKLYTPASDIYSFSMIIWEFTSGVPPFDGRAHDHLLRLNICKGERPKIIENTPQCYIDLMKKCWNEDPLKRPSSKEVLKIVEEWIILSDKTKAEDIDEELKSNIMEFINAPIE